VRVEALVGYFPNLTFIDFLQSNHEIECITYILWYVYMSVCIDISKAIPYSSFAFYRRRIYKFIAYDRISIDISIKSKDFLHEAEAFDIYMRYKSNIHNKNKPSFSLDTPATFTIRLRFVVVFVDEVHAMIRSI
jgi:hypothetical protein